MILQVKTSYSKQKKLKITSKPIRNHNTPLWPIRVAEKGGNFKKSEELNILVRIESLCIYKMKKHRNVTIFL